MKPTLLPVILAALLLSGCQLSGVSLHTASTMPLPLQAAVEVAPLAASAQLKTQHNQAQLILTLQKPQHLAAQATAPNMAFIKVSVTGPDLVTPLYPSTVDASQMLAFNGGSLITSVENIPQGALRIVHVEAYDAARTPIAGVDLKAPFAVTASPGSVNLDPITTLSGKLLQNLIAANQATFASTLNTAALYTFFAKLTGAQGTTPNFRFFLAPSLVNLAPIQTDLIAASGNIATLNSSTASYRQSVGAVSGTVAGLATDDTLTISVNDPASVPQTVRNEVFQLGNIQPGNWNVTLSGSGYVTQTVPVTVTAGGNVAMGTLNMVRQSTPSLGTVSTNRTNIGQTLTLTGGNFHPTPTGNTVKFGTTEAQVISASSTQLTVKVPPGISGSAPITVKVGGATSNSLAFTVKDYDISWSNAVAPLGGDIRQLVVDPANANIVYAATHSGGLFKTIDGGANWTSSSNGQLDFHVASVAVSGSNVFVATRFARIYKSTDSGSTWLAENTGLATPLNIRRVVIDPSGLVEVFLGIVGTAVQRSALAPVSWAPQGLPGDTTILALSQVPGSASRMLLGTPSGAYETNNNGGTWPATSLAIPARDFAYGTAPANDWFAATPNGVQRSVNGGTTWFAINTGIPAGSQDMLALANQTAVPSVLYAGNSDGKIFKTSDAMNATPGFVSWVQVASLGKKIQTLVVAPSDANRLYAGTAGDGIYTSTNAGVTWSQVNTGLTACVLKQLQTTTTTRYAATAGGVFKMPIGGSSWTSTNATLPNVDVRGFVMDTATVPESLYTGTFEGIFKSVDGGTNWINNSTGLTTLETNALVLQTPSLYAGTNGGGVFRSDNNGATWAAFNGGGLNLTINDLKAIHDNNFPCCATNRHIVYAATANGVYATRDGAGSGWTQVGNLVTGLANLQVNVLLVEANTQQTIVYAGTAAGLYKSVLKYPAAGPVPAHAWVPVTNTVGPQPILELSGSSSNLLLTAQGAAFKFFKSINGGATWVGLDTGIAASSKPFFITTDSTGTYLGTMGPGIMVMNN